MTMVTDAWAWQESWDRQQEAFMPDREHRFAAMLDVVAATAGTEAPRILDLAGGTGSISLRALDRFPRAKVTLLDQDPALPALAAPLVEERNRIYGGPHGEEQDSPGAPPLRPAEPGAGRSRRGPGTRPRTRRVGGARRNRRRR